MAPDAREMTSGGGSLRDFLSVVFRRKWIALAAMAATLAIIVYLALTSRVSFESYAQLLVSRGHPTTAFSPNLKMVSREEDLSSEMETIRSARIYRRAQELVAPRDFRITSGEPFQVVPHRITTSTPGRASIIEIFYRDYDPTIAQAVVQALTQAYREFSVEARVPDPSGYLQQEIEQLRDQLTEWEGKRAQFLMETGTVQLREERSNLLGSRRIIENDLSDARASVAEHQALLDWMRAVVDQGSEVDISTSVYPFTGEWQRGEPALAILRKTILDTKADYYEARARYTDSHPRVLALHKQLEELKEALRAEAAGYADYLEALREAALARVSSLEASLAYVNEMLSAFPNREAQLTRLDRTIDALRTTHNALMGRRLDALATRVGSNPRDVVVLQEAVEAYPVRTRDYIRMAIIPIFSLLIGLGLAFILDSLDHSLRSRAEAEAFLKLPVLATVDKFRK